MSGHNVIANNYDRIHKRNQNILRYIRVVANSENVMYADHYFWNYSSYQARCQIPCGHVFLSTDSPVIWAGQLPANYTWQSFDHQIHTVLIQTAVLFSTDLYHQYSTNTQKEMLCVIQEIDKGRHNT